MVHAGRLGLFSAFLSFSAVSADVGTTAGTFAVSPSGAATYSIAITVPPGRGGIQPTLSVDYNSQSGNGLVGLGFSLSGLSAITRCPTTLVQDGFLDPVDFDGNDRLCMDGQRLVSVYGSYGQPGTEYRTEVESFMKVIAYGGSFVGDPSYLKAWTKAGLVMEFGTTADSRIEAQGRGDGQALTWALNKVTDSVGNSYSISYSENSTTGEFVPVSIAYNGLTAITFDWQFRADVTRRYVGGSLVTQSLLLTRIRTLWQATELRSYTFRYHGSGSTGRNFLTSVEECALRTGNCLTPTILSWQSEGWGWAGNAAAYINRGRGTHGTWFGDVNGDGQSDYVTKFNDSDLHWRLGSDRLGENLTQRGLHGPGNAGLWLADINGDGLSDYITKNHDGSTYWNRSVGTGWAANQSQGGIHGVGSMGSWFVELNGDGRKDYVIKNNDESIHWNISNGTNWDSNKSQHGVHGIGNHARWLADLNGDGMSDYITMNSNGSFFWNLFTGSGWSGNFEQHGLHGAGDARTWLLDINGDGLADKVTKNRDGFLHWNLANGVGWAANQTQGNVHGPGEVSSELADINGDGMLDYVAKNRDGSIHWNLFTGTGWASSQSQQGLSQTDGESDGVWFEDINGDGMADCIVQTMDGQLRSNLSAYKPLLLTSITNGLGATVTVNYAPMTDETVYTKRTNATYPEVDLAAPIYVVASHSASNGVGQPERKVSYKYTGAKTHIRGRGFLGFAKVDVTDETSGIRETTVYRQDFPYIGMPVTSWRGTVGGRTLSETEIYYNQISLAGSSGLSTSFVYSSKTIERDWEINTNSVVKTKVIDSEYGESRSREGFYGNVTRVIHSTYPGRESPTGSRFITITENQYSNNGSAWHLGRLLRSKVTRSGPNISAASRTSGFEYDFQTGLLRAEILEPDYSSLRVRTDYVRDSYGNIIETTVSGAGIASRTTRQEYDTYGRFVSRTINAAGHITSRSFDGMGNVLTSTDPNGLIIYYQYDGFDRPTGELISQHGISVAKHTERIWCSNYSCSFYLRTYDSTGADSTVSFDKLEREISRSTKNGSNQWVTVATSYNHKGQVSQRSNPNGQATTYTYDDAGRLVIENAPAPNGQLQIASISYSGLQTTRTVADQSTATLSNAIGQAIIVTDAANGRVTYTYDAFDNLIATTDAGNARIDMVYDLRGRKVEMVDPNMGRWKYAYNVFGELTRQEDAKGQVVTFEYDSLGRMVRRTESEGATEWVYDTLRKGTLTSVSSPDYIRSYAYKPFGATESETISIASIPPPDAPANAAASTLEVNQPITGLSGAIGREHRFNFIVPSGATGLKIYTSGGSGDADLYVKRGTAPTTSSYDCRSIGNDNNDTCDFGNAAPGTYSILVRGYSSFTGVTLVGTYSYNATGTPIQNHQPLGGQFGSAGAELRFSFAVPAGAADVRFSLSGGGGNADLYVKRGAPPTLTAFDCSSKTTANAEACSLGSSAQAITYYALVHGAGPFSGLTVSAGYVFNGGTSKLANRVRLNNLAGHAGSALRYTFEVPEGTTRINIATSGGYGNSELYVRYNSAPKPSEFDCHQNGTGNSAQCDSSYAYNGVATLQIAPLNGAPLPGKYHVMVRGISTFAGASIIASFDQAAQVPSLPTSTAAASTTPGLLEDFDYMVEQIISGELIATPLESLVTPAALPVSLPPAGIPVPDNPAKERGLLAELFTPFMTSSTNYSASAAQSQALETRTITYAYDDFGRLSEITYPTGLKVRQGYNATGALDVVQNSLTGTAYWKAEQWSVWGLHSSRLGNGISTTYSRDAASGALLNIATGGVQDLVYRWDVHGNLLSRKDRLQNLEETFTYDSLNRVKTNALYGVPGMASGAQTLNMSYSATGNVLSKSGVAYTYGSTRPNAVTSAKSVSYSYDANGSLLSAGPRTYGWTSYNLPSTITEADNVTEFLYGPERQRIRQSSSSYARGGRLTYFFHSLYEEQAYSSYTEQKHYINSPQGFIAIETRGSVSTTEYLHRDHLGSIDVITNNAGQITQRLSFDAYGKRRGSNWEEKTTQELTTNWGYTGHQQQDDFNLIHMGGRVYDPGLGRFISADPIIQAPRNSQSYNRYSYVVNNPLVLTDPSGYIFGIGRKIKSELRRVERDFRHEIRRPDSLLGAAIQITATTIATVACGPCAIGVSGITSYGVAQAQGASTRDALKAGALSAGTAAAFYGVGAAFEGSSGVIADVGRVVSHGVVGGLSTVASGGKFGQGFSAAGIAAAFSPYYSNNVALGTIQAAVVGGTVAEIGGGKFANGAVTAAFGYLFNHASHRYELGPTRMCSTAQSGCTLDNALSATDSVSVPFSDNPREGYMEIGPNNDPILHHVDRQNYTISNVTLEGHTFHPGQVVHSLTVDTGLSFSWSRGFYRSEGIYLTTTGTGINTNWATASGNYVAGRVLFQRTHYMAPRLMQQYLGGP